MDTVDGVVNKTLELATTFGEQNYFKLGLRFAGHDLGLGVGFS